MGVYIDMKMPKTCGDCKAFVCYRQYAGDSGDCFCGITKSDAKERGKNDDCPLVPVPPHGRLIDADALLDDCIFSDEGFKRGMYAFIGDAPTIIPAKEEENHDQI